MGCYQSNVSPTHALIRQTKMQISHSVSARFLMLLLIGTILSGCTAESKKARFAGRAERFFRAGDYDKAKIEYLNLLRIDPQNATALSRMGLMWAEEGAPLRAGPFLVKARELAPSDLANRIKLARVFSSIGQRAEARKEAIAVLEQSPADGDAIMILVETAVGPEDIAYTEEQLQKFPQRENVSFLLASANLALRKGDPVSAERNIQRALSLDPKSAAAHTAMAVLQLSKKNISEAGEEFKTAAELAPPRSSETLKYAEFRMLTGAPEEVKEFLTRVVSQAPDFMAAWSLLAQVAIKEKKYDEALKLLDNVFGRDPDNIDARMVQAGAWIAKGENKKATEGLARLDRTYPNVPMIKFRLAQAYLQSGNPVQATAALDQVLSANPNFADAVLLRAELRLRAREPQPVIFEMIQLLKKRPDLIQARALLADAYRQLGRLDDAAAVIQEQIKLLPQSWQPYDMLGLILRQQNKTEEARQAFEKAAELNPNNLVTTDQLVELDLVKGNFDSATKRVQQQLEKTPQSAAAHVTEGKLHAAQGNFDQAEAAFLKAVDLDPNSSAAYDLLVSLYVSSNRLPDAVRQLEALLTKKPGDTRALTIAALIYQKTNDLPKARDAYEKLLAVNPDAVPALNNLAYLYSEHFNDLQKANELARKAHSLEPANPSPTDTLGWVLYKQGDYQQAVTLLQESSGKLPDNPEIQFHLGMANYMMGQTEAARAALQKASDSTVEFPGKEEARRRLALLGGAANEAERLSTAELETLSREQPNDPVALMRLGESYEAQAAFPKAAAAYEQALKANSKLTSAAVSLAQLNAGPLQNKEKAFEYAKKARELAPNDPRAAGRLGFIAFQTGNYPWAYGRLQDAARQIPDDPAIFHHLGWAAYSQGKVGEARQAMERVLKLAPASPEAAGSKAFLAMTALDEPRMDPIAADAEIDKILSADAGYVPALVARARIHMHRGNLKAAEVVYLDVLKRFPDFAPAQKYLAAIYAEDPATAAKAYDLAMSARKTLSADPDLSQTLGMLFYQRKEFSRAIQSLQDSGKSTPLDAKSLYYLGRSHLETGHPMEASEALSRAVGAGLPRALEEEAKRILGQSRGQ